MFTDSQNFAYENAESRIIERLDFYLKLLRPLHNKEPVLFILVKLLNKTDKFFIALVKEFFPTPEYEQVVNFMIYLHKFYHGNGLDHVFLKGVTDPRLFTSKKSESSEEILPEEAKAIAQEFANKLKIAIDAWLDKNFDAEGILKTDSEGEQANMQP